MNQPNNNSNPWNDSWKTLEKMLNGKLSFTQSEQLKRIVTEPGFIEKYVQNALHKVLPGIQTGLDKLAGNALRAEVFETHRSVFARIHIPQYIETQELKIHAGSRYLRITGLPDGEEETISLPAHISAKRGRAIYKDGILEIRLQKDEHPDREREILVQY